MENIKKHQDEERELFTKICNLEKSIKKEEKEEEKRRLDFYNSMVDKVRNENFNNYIDGEIIYIEMFYERINKDRKLLNELKQEYNLIILNRLRNNY